MSEEEERVIDIVEEILLDPFTTFSQDSSYESNQIKAQAIQDLLDLYKREKSETDNLIREKAIYRQLLKQAQDDVKIWRDLYSEIKNANRELKKEVIKWKGEYHLENKKYLDLYEQKISIPTINATEEMLKQYVEKAKILKRIDILKMSRNTPVKDNNYTFSELIDYGIDELNDLLKEE